MIIPEKLHFLHLIETNAVNKPDWSGSPERSEDL
jgi:hypothetical protein